MPRNTDRVPPPDPLDAAADALARFRDADDFEDPTGRYDVPPPFVVQNHVHFDSVHDGDSDSAPEVFKLPKKTPWASALAGAGALVIGALAAMKALGWL
jgi:hypothetical protein